MALTNEQSEAVMKVWNAYLEGGEKYVYPVTGFTHKVMDQQRVAVIPDVKKLLDKFINGSVTVEDFRIKIDEINKKNLLWGFNGTNGQAFFNLIAKASVEANLHTELNNLFKETLPSPVTPDFAVNNIRTFSKFTQTLLGVSHGLLGALKAGSIPYFLSYFWQVQKPDTWPIYYTAMVNELSELEIWKPSEDIAKNYSEFYELNYQMIDLLDTKTGKEVKLWDIEHAFWDSAILKTSQPVVVEPPPPVEVVEEMPTQLIVKPSRSGSTVRVPRKSIPAEPRPVLSESYIPPVLSILPALASEDARVGELVRQSGKTIDQVYKDRLSILFKMMGYDTDVLGQGRGKVPDGLATCQKHQYAIIYDGKISQQAYTLGSDESEINDYIIKIGDRLRKKEFRSIYYMVIANKFSDENDSATRALKIETGANEVILAEVSALLFLLEQKLRDPDISLGPRCIQKLLAASGLLTTATARDFFES
jgi:hypothetical protein